MIWTLLKVRIRAFFASFRRGSRKRSKAAGPLTALLFAYLAVVLCGSFYMLFNTLSRLLSGPDAWFYFALMGLIATGLSFILTLFAAQSAIFEARDNDLLLSMPLTPRAILFSRVGQLLFMCYIYQALIILPALLVWLQSGTALPARIALAIPAVMLLPFFTLTLSCLLGWLVSFIASRVRRKNLVTTLLSLLLLGAYFSVAFSFERYAALVLQDSLLWAQRLKNVLYPLYCFGAAIAAASMGQFLLFLLFALLPFGLVFGLMERNFIRITTHTGHMRKAEYKERANRIRMPIAALVHKEIRRFLSSPVYMLNAGLGLFMMVACAVLFLLKGNALLASLAADGLPPTVSAPALLAAGLCFCAGMTFISAPSLSLEGENLWIIKSLPLAPGILLEAKARAHIVICLPFVLLSALIGLLCPGLTPSYAVSLFLLPLCVVLCCAYLGVAINLHFPRFDWLNETQVIKQSLASLLSMLASFGLISAGVALYFPLRAWLRIDLYLLLLSALLLLLTLLLRAYLCSKRAARRFSAL